MKKILILTTALSTVAFAASADVTVMSWGGAYGEAQNEAFVKPFVAATGKATIMVDSDNPAPAIKAMVEAGNVTVDVASVEYADAIRLCDEGVLEPIDAASLPAGADGTPAADDFIPGAVTECGVSTDIWSNVFAYDTTKFPEGPKVAADFFDLEKFPGKRGLRKGAKAVLELALMGDGVAAAEVYNVLSTPEGVDRAFAKLDTIKKDVVWWEAGSQAPQLLADGEVSMTTAYNGRIFAAAMNEGKPFQIVWDGQIYENEMFVVPKGAPNAADAMEFVKFATSTEGLRASAQQISYGPARKSSLATEIVFKDGKTVMAPHLPTAPENMGNALETSATFWVDHDAELNERFQAWLSQ
ncbi:MAG: putative spermidine/putrescine transport system substrate-binding protein [Rhodobacteraceae bacterium]|uniref:ABC transporter substrate-binding protein n=1 Tax=Cypionkella sp. TaxID=2811411 RepID=UPI00132A93E2|nr:ABC transporter substrate-binding protein [Cypionkella sp.]KAF0173062.1 MAG: putative spermidine/putrescine transport system substrate-binding protein [Paracoccaceae bacterium]MDO8326276.1 ABC transporter substrate-binding protein [Cypionkella sp.]